MVESDVHSAARLLKTSFRKLWNGKTKQSAVRAGSYTIPDEVEGAISTIFGLHGLPLPPRKTRVLNEDAADQAAAVTPDVILKQCKMLMRSNIGVD